MEEKVARSKGCKVDIELDMEDRAGWWEESRWW
jgi:hypothetical protein